MNAKQKSRDGDGDGEGGQDTSASGPASVGRNRPKKVDAGLEDAEIESPGGAQKSQKSTGKNKGGEKVLDQGHVIAERTDSGQPGHGTCSHRKILLLRFELLIVRS